MSDYKQNPVSASVWPWPHGGPIREEKPSTLLDRLVDRAVWLECFIHVCVALVIGWFILYNHFEKPILAKVVWTISAIIVLSAIFSPRVHRAIKKGFIWFGAKVGLLVTWLVLVPFFYLCFWPGRIILKIRGIDPMHRKFPTHEPTYWIRRPKVDHIDQYKKQH